MKKIMTEDEKMLEIIHENFKKQRVFNQKRAKKRKKEEIISNVLTFFGGTTFLLIVFIFIAVVENLKF